MTEPMVRLGPSMALGFTCRRGPHPGGLASDHHPPGAAVQAAAWGAEPGVPFAKAVAA